MPACRHAVWWRVERQRAGHGRHGGLMAGGSLNEKSSHGAALMSGEAGLLVAARLVPPGRHLSISGLRGRPDMAFAFSTGTWCCQARNATECERK